MTTLIGLVGRKGAGKDTTAGRLQLLAAAHYGITLERVSFAEPLKIMCADLFAKGHGVPWQAFYGTQAEKEAPLLAHGLDVSGRDILKAVGTDAIRRVAPDIWIRIAMRQAEAAPAAVLTDVRYRNEGIAIHARGGILVRLTRGQGGDTHLSETELDHIPCEYILDNATWSLEQLQERLEDLAWVLWS